GTASFSRQGAQPVVPLDSFISGEPWSTRASGEPGSPAPDSKTYDRNDPEDSASPLAGPGPVKVRISRGGSRLSPPIAWAMRSWNNDLRATPCDVSSQSRPLLDRIGKVNPSFALLWYATGATSGVGPSDGQFDREVTVDLTSGEGLVLR